MGEIKTSATKYYKGYEGLVNAVCNFAVEIGFEAGKEDYNKAWQKLWKTVDNLGIFSKEIRTMPDYV